MLESALAQPRQTFGGEDLYPLLVEKASALGFSLRRSRAERGEAFGSILLGSDLLRPSWRYREAPTSRIHSQHWSRLWLSRGSLPVSAALRMLGKWH